MKIQPQAFLLALRPKQWVKNAVVLAPVFFAAGDRAQRLNVASVAEALLAALLFCVVSSGIYVMNDLCDRDADRLHPVKRLRPVASGALPVGAARVLMVALLLVGLGGSFAASLELGGVLTGYALLQVAYTLFLKRIALVDVFVIAAGFVMRAGAGAVAAQVAISPWLLLCAFLLALFLALCKRRHEKRLLDDRADGHRASLEGYDARLLDLLIAIVSAVTIACYAIYTLWPETVEKFHSHGLGLTVPLVIFGMFRYLDLVYRHEQGGHPERVLFGDSPLLFCLGAYALTVLAVFHRGLFG
ncbi:MAG: decaprenyl-phosphate phosphoribosyltransferase [bacterium]